ncbi:TPA: DnaD domain protein [Streptococcus suis]|uniref:DnaD domain protein n=1 Tax=Streptococcus suis TaxID=1307 RepID=UPI000944093A|nr:DnaD domain protein [Streptococcus suis]HEL2702703.1 DnaD domain protein [Streptococcus suis]
MGNRRMISKTVTQTQRFLRLPLEAQALYFHLIQNSDDDGVVEAFPVVRMIGVSEDSLGLLIVKDFIRPLNEEMVYFITDFHEQNTVRKDRYSPSIYKHLLEKPPEKNIGLPTDNQEATTGLPNISQYKSSQYNLSQSRSSPKDEDQEIKNPIFEKLKEAFGEMSVNGTMIAEVEDLLKIHGQSLLLYALEVTILNAGKSIRYTRTILANWQGQGLRTVEQVKQHEEKRQQQKQPQTQLESTSYEEWLATRTDENPF